MGHDSIRKAKYKRWKVTEAVIDICDLWLFFRSSCVVVVVKDAK